MPLAKRSNPGPTSDRPVRSFQPGHDRTSKRRSSPEEDIAVAERRREAGEWLRKCREALGLTQQQISRALDIEYYTFITQIENGHARIPERLYVKYADILGIQHDKFLARCLYYYHHSSISENFSIVKKLVKGA
jgi:ribosome-binding protein aMBF1 (putative translation factor)